MHAHIRSFSAKLFAIIARALIGAAADKEQPPEYRIRALDLMQLFGPSPRRFSAIPTINQAIEGILRLDVYNNSGQRAGRPTL